jgi:hypothetical protein
MSQQPSHPSYLRLDRHCLGVLDDAATAAHVEHCARCRSYVARYAPAEQVPAWLSAAAQTPLRSARTPQRAQVLTWLSAAALAAACLVLIWLKPPSDGPYVGVKGAPAALVHVQHAGSTAVWNGEALAAGDKIRIEVMPAEFGYVSVFSWSSTSKPPVSLYAGRVKQRSTSLLPKAWELDSAPGPELLVIFFGHAIVSEAAAEALLRAHDPADVAIVRVLLPKRGAR